MLSISAKVEVETKKGIVEESFEFTLSAHFIDKDEDGLEIIDVLVGRTRWCIKS